MPSSCALPAALPPTPIKTAFRVRVPTFKVGATCKRKQATDRRRPQGLEAEVRKKGLGKISKEAVKDAQPTLRGIPAFKNRRNVRRSSGRAGRGKSFEPEASADRGTSTLGEVPSPRVSRYGSRNWE